MTISYPILSFAQSMIVARAARYTAGTVMGLTMLTWIANRAGSSTEVVIHVTEANVEIHVGGHSFRIDERSYEPILLHLHPGPYELVMTRSGRVVSREAFEVRSGEACVLTAYDPERRGPDPGLPSPPGGPNEFRRPHEH
ncbi:hypothetical protein AB1L88_19310 [Tautonia sp. JC769]|uniref:hypothetical protein n=1 Tax=Tautonia sp. JC769 TaxID=3232135 RepID=UPI0034598645